jgi:hypothetical protein
MKHDPELPSATEIEGLTSVAWVAKAVTEGPRYRVEAVAVGRGILSGVPVVFYSAFTQPDEIEAMELKGFRYAMEPSRSAR